MRFTPRCIYTNDIVKLIPDKPNLKIQLKFGLARFYEITDICHLKNKWWQVVAVDRHDNILTLREVTDKVSCPLEMETVD